MSSKDRQPLVLGVGRGRALATAQPLLRALGCDLEKQSRNLFVQGDGVRLLIARNWDIPVYVAEGAADLGLVGRDVLEERAELDLYEPLDTGLCRCSVIVAAKSGQDFPQRPRLASRFTHLAQNWLDRRYPSGRVIPLQGSLERAPHLGLADAILDQMDTGNSLRENNLSVYDTLFESSLRLILNKASARLRMGEVDALIARIEQELGLC